MLPLLLPFNHSNIHFIRRRHFGFPIDASPFGPHCFPNFLVQPARLCFRLPSLSRPPRAKLISKSNYNLTLRFVQPGFNLKIVLKTRLMSVLSQRGVLSQAADPCGGSLLSHVISLPPCPRNCQNETSERSAAHCMFSFTPPLLSLCKCCNLHSPRLING